MADKRETVEPDGGAIQWSDDQIAALIGITEQGQISPSVLADAKADARKNPTLAALLNAKPIEDKRGQ
jgi:hypothetical protein